MEYNFVIIIEFFYPFLLLVKLLTQALIRLKSKSVDCLVFVNRALHLTINANSTKLELFLDVRDISCNWFPIISISF